MTLNFDEVLINNGLTLEGVKRKENFPRDDKPPSNSLLITSRYFGPKKTSVTDEFPFDPLNTDSSIAMTANEVNEWEIDRIEKLLELYKQQLELLPAMADANKTAIFNAKASERRKYFYYCHLMAITNAPKDIAFKNLDELNCLRKLWRNKAFQQDVEGLSVPDQCCEYDSCPFIAIHGSKYCGWHILNDPKQKLFESCPVCGNPRVICDGAACPGHKGTPKAAQNATSAKSQTPKQPPLPIVAPTVYPVYAPKQPIIPTYNPMDAVAYHHRGVALYEKYNSKVPLTEEEQLFLNNFLNNLSSKDPSK